MNHAADCPTEIFLGWTRGQWAVVLWSGELDANHPITDLGAFFDCRAHWVFRWRGENPPKEPLADWLAPREYHRLAESLFSYHALPALDPDDYPDA